MEIYFRHATEKTILKDSFELSFKDWCYFSENLDDDEINALSESEMDEITDKMYASAGDAEVYIDVDNNLRYDGVCATRYPSDNVSGHKDNDSVYYIYAITGDYNGSTISDDGVVICNPKIIKSHSLLVTMVLVSPKI